MKNLPWDHEKDCETVWHTVKPWDLRGLGTSELKIKLFCFFTIRAMVWIFIAVKSRYLNLSAVLKFAKTQIDPKLAETK